MKAVFGIKIPQKIANLITDEKFEFFKLYQNSDVNVFGRLFEENKNNFFEINDFKTSDMNEFSNMSEKTEEESLLLAKDIEKLLQHWNGLIQETVKNIENITPQELKQRYDEFEFPENLEFNWFILNE